jgi:hypothetical protein
LAQKQKICYFHKCTVLSINHHHHHHDNAQGQDTHDLATQQSLEKGTNELLDTFSFSGTKR